MLLFTSLTTYSIVTFDVLHRYLVTYNKETLKNCIGREAKEKWKRNGEGNKYKTHAHAHTQTFTRERERERESYREMKKEKKDA